MRSKGEACDGYNQIKGSRGSRGSIGSKGSFSKEEKEDEKSNVETVRFDLLSFHHNNPNKRNICTTPLTPTIPTYFLSQHHTPHECV